MITYWYEIHILLFGLWQHHSSDSSLAFQIENYASSILLVYGHSYHIPMHFHLSHCLCLSIRSIESKWKLDILMFCNTLKASCSEALLIIHYPIFVQFFYFSFVFPYIEIFIWIIRISFIVIAAVIKPWRLITTMVWYEINDNF